MAARELKDNGDYDIGSGIVSGGIREYWATSNATSIDGLPGFVSAPTSKFLPSYSWTEEEESVQEKYAVIVSGGNDEADRYWNFNIRGRSHTAVSFFAGIFVTLACLNAFRSLSRG